MMAHGGGCLRSVFAVLGRMFCSVPIAFLCPFQFVIESFCGQMVCATAMSE